VLDDLVAKGTITESQKQAILDGITAERTARQQERQAQRQQLKDFIADGQITQDELDQLPADSPLRQLTGVMDDGKITTDELRQLGRGFGQRSLEELFLAREVVVQQRLRDARLARDLRHRQLFERVRREQLGPDFEQLGPSLVHFQAPVATCGHPRQIVVLLTSGQRLGPPLPPPSPLGTGGDRRSVRSRGRRPRRTGVRRR
jgi:hypothetical protein